MPNRPPVHKPNRPKTTKKGNVKYAFLNTARWKAIRRRFLAKHPVCECGAIATEVHHIDDTHRSTEDNLEARCKSCHSKITCREQGGVGKPKLDKPASLPRQLPEDFRFG